jgi:hypothetical protein
MSNARSRSEMPATAAVLSDSSASEKVESRFFERVWLIALVLVVLAVEVGWVALLGYGLVFLFS